MKKKVMTLALMCCLGVSGKAQVYPGDSWVQLPTMDLYDTGVSNMYLRALAETAALRKENYHRYCELAVEAYKGKNWNYVVLYVNEALETKYYSGMLYYLRGYAYEQLGNLRAAKKDYKTGKKHDCPEAAQALESLKAKNKRK